MKLLDRYLLAEWLKMLGLLLAATIGLLLITALSDKLRELIDVGAGAGDILLYFATLMPSYLTLVLPLSMLLSLLFVLGKLHRNNELTAIRAAGLNIFATTRSLWLAGLFFCGVSLLLNSSVVPWSVETSRSLLERFEFRAEAEQKGGDTLGLVSSVAFDNRPQNRMWFINRYSRYSGKSFGVTVSELDPQRREKTRLMAREATYDAGQRAWTFRDGRELWFDPELGELLRSVSFAEKTVPHFREDPALMLLIDRRPQDLSFNELQRITDYFHAEHNPKVLRYEVRYYSVMFSTLGPLIVIAIAVPFAVSGVRVSPAVGVSKSIGLFFVYYLLSSLATILGGKGLVEPVWAAAMPNLAMIGIAAWFFGRMR
ncbi:LptF/LptG family permease [Lacunisphaera limnophila]|uniref:LptF/LptG family permease n=1 Tax=Lacunisphaera limnophila TaxID=1838286 RepID=UPI0008597F38|nr:LptF/LptG family permease [Lacunisphaera limnophila]